MGEHDMHGGYGRCNGRRSVWVDDGEASGSYTQGTCPDCAKPEPPSSDELDRALRIWLRAMETGRSEPLFIARDHTLRLLGLRPGEPA